MSNTWQRCPVCHGNGLVCHGFYNYPVGQTFSSSSAEPEQCMTCGGRGIIVSPEQEWKMYAPKGEKE